MSVLIALSAVGVIASLAYYVAAGLAAARFASRAAAPASSAPGALAVTMLKPLNARHEALSANLETFVVASSPDARVVLGVGADEPAAPIARDFARIHPRAPIVIVEDTDSSAANRKVGKLIRMAERAPDADLFVISDADVRVEPDYLRRLMSEISADEEIGVVTCAYRARPRGGFASRMEAMFVNTDFAPMVMLSAAIEPMRHALGATMAVRRPALEAIGGFQRLKDVLADDFFLGRLVADCGYKVELSRTLVTLVCEERNFSQFWNHQLRWARTYRSVRPVSLATILIHGPFWALVLLLASGFNPLAILAFIVVIGARIAMARSMIERVLRMPDLAREAWLVPLKDFVMTAIWFAGLLGKRVRWGDRSFEILSGGAMREVRS